MPYPQQVPSYQVASYSNNRMPPSPQTWQPAPPQASNFQAPAPHQQNWDPQQTWNEFNNPPEPQYGIPERQPNPHSPRAGHHKELGQEGDGERGLGATLVGGAGGAFLGHKMEGGKLGTIGGLALGALAANAYEDHEKKKNGELHESRAFGEGYADGEDRPHHHHSRGIDEEEEYSDDRYDDEDYYQPRHHHHHHDSDYDGDYYQDDYREEYYDRRDDY